MNKFLEIKLIKDLFCPDLGKINKEGTEIKVCVSSEGLPLDKKWRKIFRDNEISPIFSIIKNNKLNDTKKSKD